MTALSTAHACAASHLATDSLREVVHGPLHARQEVRVLI